MTPILGGMSDDSGILLFLAIGVLVLAGIVFFGVRSSRTKKTADRRTWTVRTEWIGEQRFIASSDIALDDRRQEELFRLTYPIGGVVPLTGPVEPDGNPATTELTVSRIGRSLRAGWPQAKLGLTAYFAPWESSEFPARFAVKGSNRIVVVTLDVTGVTALDSTEQPVWSARWAELTFSNGPDIVLAGGTPGPVRIEYPEGHPEFEEILIKYGTLKQMHF